MASSEDGEIMVTIDDTIKYMVQQIMLFAPNLVEPIIKGFMRTVVQNYGLPEEVAEDIMNNHGFSLEPTPDEILTKSMNCMEMDE